jgi:hypothetical protein
MATINHKTYNEATETFKDFSVYDGKETLIFKVDGADQTVYASNIIGSGIIKTSDNGPLSATAKYLSDGLGNNSALALSTRQGVCSWLRKVLSFLESQLRHLPNMFASPLRVM